MKLAIVGTGKIVKTLLPGVQKWGWEISGLCGTKRSEGEIQRLRQEYGIPAGHTDYAAMLKQTDAEVVYIGTPNHLHFDMIRQALEAGKHVIAEKPITSNIREAETLAALAKEKRLFLFEAITTLYLPAFLKTKELLPQIGQVKLVSCNFSQYSSRYDAFRRGEILPAFDPAKSGGALMDLNIYNLHYVLGLFGSPERISYRANVERGIDTGGMLDLDYPDFRCVCIAAKDCAAPSICLIQGTNGYIRMDGPANCCGRVTLHRNDGSEEFFEEQPEHRMEPEFWFFRNAIASGDPAGCYAKLDHSVEVSRIQTAARLGAGIYFPADETET